MTIDDLARALYAASDSLLTWDETGTPERRLYRNLARAAVLALAADLDNLLDELPVGAFREAAGTDGYASQLIDIDNGQHGRVCLDSFERINALVAEARAQRPRRRGGVSDDQTVGDRGQSTRQAQSRGPDPARTRRCRGR